MRNIITAYLVREFVKSSAATMLVLYIILVSNALGRVLADIADGDVPQQALWPVMLAQSVNLLSLLLPIGVFLGIVFALGRLYKDHEIVVMHACGIGYREFYHALAIVLLPLALVSAGASLWLNASAQRYAEAIIEREESLHEFEQVRPGQFNQSSDGNHVIYLDSISADRLELRELIVSQTNRDVMVFETARTGRHRVDEVTGDLFLVVGPGVRHEGEAGRGDFNIIEFEQHGILIEKQAARASKLRREALPTTELWDSPAIKDRVELQWRIAIPVALLVLGLLAVPLAYVAPRRGRFGKVGLALLVYVLYMNLMAVTRTQLEAGSLPMAVNFWWVHAMFVAFALMLLWRRNRGLARLRA